MSACGKGCNKRLIAKTKISCTACSKDFHHSCVGILEKDVTQFTSGEAIWLCELCKDKLPNNTNLNSSNGNNNNTDNLEPTIANVFAIVQQILSEQKSFMNTLAKHDEEIIKLNEKCDAQQNKIDENNIDINELKNAVSILQTENEDLKHKLNETNQQSRLNCLEITGVPEPGRGENVFLTVQLVTSALGFRLESSMVSDCFRMRANTGGRSKIIVCFTKTTFKWEILKCRKIKADFSTLHLDNSLRQLVKEHKAIYINEFLTSYNKKLFLKAKEYKNQNNIKFIWIKNCNIYMRKSENSKIILIKSENDIQEVK